MERRSDLGGKDEHPRDQVEFTGYLEDLKAELMKRFEVENGIQNNGR
jgi:hypothetical protein